MDVVLFFDTFGMALLQLKNGCEENRLGGRSANLQIKNEAIAKC